VHSYEWALLRVVPRVERGEFVNVGVLVYCRALDYLAVRLATDLERATALDPSLDEGAVTEHLAAVRDLCDGQPAAGQNGRRSPGERFRWLVAPRSTVVQPSAVHTGVTADPASTLAELFTAMVAPPPSAGTNRR
jgi:hypothetical protein